MTHQEHQRASLGSPARFGEVKRHVVVADPRVEGAHDLVRMDIAVRHTPAVTEETLPRRLDDDSERAWPLDRPS